MDHFAAQSHQRAGRAQAEGLFDSEILPVMALQLPKTPAPGGTTPPARIPVLVSRDDGIRADSTAEGLSKIRAAFPQWGNGTTTGGNASQLTDGVAAVLLMTRRKAKELGLTILGRHVQTVVAGLPPRIMGVVRLSPPSSRGYVDADSTLCSGTDRRHPQTSQKLEHHQGRRRLVRITPPFVSYSTDTSATTGGRSTRRSLRCTPSASTNSVSPKIDATSTEEVSPSVILSDVPVLGKSRLDSLSSSDEVERFSLRVCASVPVWELLRSGLTSSRTLRSTNEVTKSLGNLLELKFRVNLSHHFAELRNNDERERRAKRDGIRMTISMQAQSKATSFFFFGFEGSRFFFFTTFSTALSVA